jgi:hypothetical protein
VPADEQAKIAGGNTARVDRFDVATLIVPAEDIIPSCAASRSRSEFPKYARK